MLSYKGETNQINVSGLSQTKLLEDISTRTLESVTVGEEAGKISRGEGNAFVGYQSGKQNTFGSFGVFVGFQAGQYNQNSDFNTFVGAFSGRENNRGFRNTFVGFQAGELNKDGSDCTAVGAYALRENTIGLRNVAVGNRAGERILDGDNNTMIGMEAGQDIRSGNNNTMAGYRSGRATFRNNENTYFGAYAGYSNSVGDGNAFVGYRAGENLIQGSFNVAVGTYALHSAQYGDCNIAIGAFAGSVTTGGNSVFVGTGAGAQNVDGDNNTYIGTNAGFNSQGSDNVYIGKDAACNLTGNKNVVIGVNAYEDIQSEGSVIIGYRAGTTRFNFGNSNILIGINADTYTQRTSNAIVIGSKNTKAYNESISIGENIDNGGINSLSIGYDINVDGDKTIIVGNQIDIKSVYVFNDALNYRFPVQNTQNYSLFNLQEEYTNTIFRNGFSNEVAIATINSINQFDSGDNKEKGNTLTSNINVLSLFNYNILYQGQSYFYDGTNNVVFNITDYFLNPNSNTLRTLGTDFTKSNLFLNSSNLIIDYGIFSLQENIQNNVDTCNIRISGQLLPFLTNPNFLVSCNLVPSQTPIYTYKFETIKRNSIFKTTQNSNYYIEFEQLLPIRTSSNKTININEVDNLNVTYSTFEYLDTPPLYGNYSNSSYYSYKEGYFSSNDRLKVSIVNKISYNCNNYYITSCNEEINSHLISYNSNYNLYITQNLPIFSDIATRFDRSYLHMHPKSNLLVSFRNTNPVQNVLLGVNNIISTEFLNRDLSTSIVELSPIPFSQQNPLYDINNYPLEVTVLNNTYNVNLVYDPEIKQPVTSYETVSMTILPNLLDSVSTSAFTSTYHTSNMAIIRYPTYGTVSYTLNSISYTPKVINIDNDSFELLIKYSKYNRTYYTINVSTSNLFVTVPMNQMQESTTSNLLTRSIASNLIITTSILPLTTQWTISNFSSNNPYGDSNIITYSNLPIVSYNCNIGYIITSNDIITSLYQQTIKPLNLNIPNSNDVIGSNGIDYFIYNPYPPYLYNETYSLFSSNPLITSNIITTPEYFVRSNHSILNRYYNINYSIVSQKYFSLASNITYFTSNYTQIDNIYDINNNFIYKTSNINTYNFGSNFTLLPSLSSNVGIRIINSNIYRQTDEYNILVPAQSLNRSYVYQRNGSYTIDYSKTSNNLVILQRNRGPILSFHQSNINQRDIYILNTQQSDDLASTIVTSNIYFTDNKTISINYFKNNNTILTLNRPVTPTNFITYTNLEKESYVLEYLEDYTNIAIQSTSNISFVIRETQGASVFFNTTLRFDPTSADIYAVPDIQVGGDGYIEYINYKIDISGAILYGKPIRKTLRTAYIKNYPIFYNTNFSYNPLTFITPNTFYYVSDLYPIILYKVISQNSSFNLQQNGTILQINDFFTQQNIIANNISINYNSILPQDNSIGIEIYTSNNILVSSVNLQAKAYDIIDYYQTPSSTEILGDIYIIQTKSTYLKTFSPSFWRNNILQNKSHVIPNFILTEPPQKGFLSYSNIQPLTQISLSNLVNENIYYIPYEPMQLENDTIRGIFSYDKTLSPEYRFNIKNYHSIWEDFIITEPVYNTQLINRSAGMISDNIRWIPESISLLEREPIVNCNIITGFTSNLIALPEKDILFQLRYLNTESIIINEKVRYLPITKQPSFTSNLITLNVDSGNFNNLSSLLNVINDPRQNVVFYITEPPSRGVILDDLEGKSFFTSSNIRVGKAFYQHFGENTSNDQFKVRVATTPWDASLTELTVNLNITDQPFLLQNNNQYIYFNRLSDASNTYNLLSSNIIQLSSGYINIFEKRNIDLFRLTSNTYTQTTIVSKEDLDTNRIYYRPSQTFFSQGSNINEPLTFRFNVNSDSVTTNFNTLGSYSIYANKYNFQWFSKINTYESVNTIVSSINDLQVISYSNINVNTSDNVFKPNLKTEIQYEFLPFQNVFSLPDNPSFIKTYYYTYKLIDKNNQSLLNAIFTHNGIEIETSNNPPLSLPAINFNNRTWNRFNITNYDPVNDDTLSIKLNNINYTSGLNFTNLRLEDLKDIIIEVPVTFDLNFYLIQNTSNINSTNLDIASNVFYYNLINYNTQLRFRNFNIFLSGNTNGDIITANLFNIAVGDELNITGINNICLGKNFKTNGEGSIILGTNIGINEFDIDQPNNDIFNSIIISNDSFRNSIVRDVIAIGNNVLNDITVDTTSITSAELQRFLAKKPVLIGNDIGSSQIDFHVNFQNTFLKTTNNIPKIYCGFEGEEVYIAYTSNIKTINETNTDFKLHVNGGLEINGIFKQVNSGTSDVKYVYGNILYNKGTIHRYTKVITWANLQLTDYNSFTVIGKFKCITDKGEYSWHRFELIISSKNDDVNNKPNLLSLVDLVGYNTPAINSFNIVVNKTSERSISLSLRFSTSYTLTELDYLIASLDLEIIHNTVLGDIIITDVEEVSEEELFGPRLLLIAGVLTGTNNSVVSSWNNFQTFAVGGASLPFLRTNETDKYVRFGTGGISTIVGNYLEFGNSITWNLNTNNGFTFFGVVRNYTLDTQEQTLYAFDSSLGIFYYDYFTQSPGIYTRIDNVLIGQPYSISQTEWNLVGVRIKKDNPSGYMIELYRNSNIYTSNDNANLQDITTTNNHIGKPINVSSVYANIDIKEALWYDRWLDDSETDEIISYLKNKYSLNFSGLLDSINTTTIINSYSLQLLNGKYFGPMIRVRRSTDNVQADVYYDKLGNVTQVLLLNGGTALYGPSALNNFKGSGTLYVHTWYDQYGFTNLTSFVNSEQPILDTTDMYVHINNTVSSTIRLSYGNQFVLTNATFVMDIKPVQGIQQAITSWKIQDPIFTNLPSGSSNDFGLVLQQGNQFGVGIGTSPLDSSLTYTNGFNLQSIMAVTRNYILSTNNIQLYKDGGKTDILNNRTLPTGSNISNNIMSIGFDPINSSRLNAKLKTILYFNSIETRSTINSITRLLGNVVHNIPGLYAWYDANSFSIDGINRLWYDMSENERNISSSDMDGPITKSFNSNVYSISGGTDSWIRFFNASILPSEYTLFHVAKYNGANKKRIFDGNGNNWLSGFWNGNTGVAYHGSDTNYSDMVIREYPPIAMTANTTLISGQSYGNGTYIVSAINERVDGTNTNYVYKAFDKSEAGTNSSSDGWATLNGFHFFNNIWNGPSTTFAGVSYAGPWIRIQLPDSIIATSFQLKPNNLNVCPIDLYFFGSTNGNTWTLIQSYTGLVWNNDQLRTFTISNVTSYTFYQWVWTSINSLGTYLPRMAEIKLFGIPNQYNSWLTPIQDQHGDNWVFSTDQNNLYRSNKIQRSISSTPNASTQLTINQGSATAERSDWAVAEIIIYDRKLNITEIETIENYLTTKYNPLVPAAINRYILFSAYNVGYFNGYDLDYSNYNRMTFTPNETITWLTITGLRCSAAININPLTADKLLYGVALYRRDTNLPWNKGDLGTSNQFYMIIQGGSNAGRIVRIDVPTATLQADTDPGPTRGEQYYFYFTTSHTSNWYYLRSLFNNYAFIHNYHFIRPTTGTPVQTIDDAYLWMVV